MELKTKEVAERLGVSQTTVKRWAAHFPTTFHKTSLGHYFFTEQDFTLLQYIQKRLLHKERLQDIELPHSIKHKQTAFREKERANAKSITPVLLSSSLSTLKARQVLAPVAASKEIRASSPSENTTKFAAQNTAKHAKPLKYPDPSPANQDVKKETVNEEMVLHRLAGIERTLEEKADGVVSTQVLQHRIELEEIYQTLKQIAVEIESLREPILDKTPPSIIQDSPLPEKAVKKRKRKFLFF